MAETVIPPIRLKYSPTSGEDQSLRSVSCPRGQFSSITRRQASRMPVGSNPRAEQYCACPPFCRPGTVAWRTSRLPLASPRWSFATPLVIEVQGARQFVSPAAQMVCSYDPATGQELWRVRYPNKWSIVPRPVFSHGLVFVCTGYDGPAELLAIGRRGPAT